MSGFVQRLGPELIVASGDLTNRGRREEHERAARYLRSFGIPVLAIPGNHDMPYTFPARFTRTFTEFERQWRTTEPIHTSPGLHVVGLNSARLYRHQGGALRADQLRDAAERLRGAPVGAYRSDGVERITADEVRSLVEATFAASSAPSFTADGRPA